jgi:hypothetical protein
MNSGNYIDTASIPKPGDEEARNTIAQPRSTGPAQMNFSSALIVLSRK